MANFYVGCPWFCRWESHARIFWMGYDIFNVNFRKLSTYFCVFTWLCLLFYTFIIYGVFNEWKNRL